MKPNNLILGLLLIGLSSALSAQKQDVPFYQSKAFSIYPDRITQGNNTAKTISSNELMSDFRIKEKSKWTLTKDISAFPQYKSDYPITDAIYKLATEEMINAVEPDSTFRTGKSWSGVWTRDISYSIILSMAHLQPNVAKYSLLRKVKNTRIIQDTGTGGSYPVSTDRIIWATGAWEIYKATGDKDWLAKSYQIIKNSIEDDMVNAYDPQTGLVKGESSFLDWREQTYPLWMQAADIYESECLATNAIHYQANVILSKMATLLNDKTTAEKHIQNAEKIKTGINKHLWLNDKGYYAQYMYGRNFKTVSPRSEALGEALCVWFGIADAQKQQSIISNVPVMDFGISCIYPQIPNMFAYHNNAVWPFVQSYWGLASAKVGNEKSVLESMAAVYRIVAFALTNKENFVANSGDYEGTAVNSDNMLWSLSGNLALVQKIIFGIQFGTDSLTFHPFVPESLAGNRSLTNFKCRKAILDIELKGFGNKIQQFVLDGKVLPIAAIPYSLTGRHTIQIALKNEKLPVSKINKVADHISPETPVVKYEKGLLQWTSIPGAKGYIVLKNGQKLLQTTKTALKIPTGTYSEYQVMAVDSINITSFASEPLVILASEYTKTYELENYTANSLLDYKDYQGTGFVEISKTENRNITIPVEVKKTGLYAITFRYSNGNGSLTGENKCAIRSIKVGDHFAGIVVFPQRGEEEWSKWGNSNSVQVKLTKGKNKVSIVFGTRNDNMNIDVNQAMLDAMTVYQIQ